MEAYRENVDMPDKLLPARAFMTLSSYHELQVHPHWHEEIEILYFMDGTANQQVSDHFFHVKKGDIVIIGSDELHSTYTHAGSDNKILVIQFDASGIMPAGITLPEIKLIEAFKRQIIYPNPIDSKTAPGKAIEQCLNDIFQELRQKNHGYELLVKSGIYQLVGLVVRNYGSNMKSRSDAVTNKRTYEMLSNTFALLDNSFSENITLEQAAAASNLSITHFCRLFKKATGMTFKEYLTFYRVNRAEKLLRAHASVTEAAETCGFGDITSFIRNFKKFKGCTPSAYKLAYK